MNEHKEIDEARMLGAFIAMHGFLASPVNFTKDEIVKDSVELADKLLTELERTTK